MYTVTAFWHYVYIKEERLDMIFCGTFFFMETGIRRQLRELASCLVS